MNVIINITTHIFIMKNILKSIGFTENEAIVYLALLNSGTTTAGNLIKTLGTHRATVYDTLNLLIEKGIVSFVTKNDKKYFKADNPEKLILMTEAKKQFLEKNLKELKEKVPKIKAVQENMEEEQEAFIFKGKNGLKSICEDVLKEKKQWLVFGAKGIFAESMPHYFSKFHKKRAKLGIPMRIIRNQETKNAKWSKKLKLREERFLPDIYATPSTTFIYSNKTAIVVWLPEPTAFLIKSKTVANSYRKHFEVLWKAATP